MLATGYAAFFFGTTFAFALATGFSVPAALTFGFGLSADLTGSRRIPRTSWYSSLLFQP